MALFLPMLLISILNQAQNTSPDWWQPNGDISTIDEDTILKRLYIGGHFSRVGKPRLNSTIFDKNTGQESQGTNQPNEAVYCSVTDGQGGWYIGGNFTKIGDSVRYRIAHIDNQGNPTGRLRNKGFDQEVTELCLINGKLAVAGSFQSYDKYSLFHRYGAILDTLTGTDALSVAEPNGPIESLISDGKGGWFISGSFSYIGDSARYGFAHLAANGEVDEFNIRIEGTVATMALHDSLLYIGGEFSSIGDSSRYNIGCINIQSQRASSWKPVSGGIVRSIVATDTVIYAAGEFYGIGGEVRFGIAAVSTVTGKATAWAPSVQGEIKQMALQDESLYIIGNIYKINNITQYYIGALDIRTGDNKNWYPYLDKAVNSYTIYGDKLIVGGEFTMVNQTPRNGLAAIDMTTGSCLPWNPAPNGKINAMAKCGERLYIAGEFDTIGEYRCYKSASIKLSDGLALSWDVNIGEMTNTITSDGTNLFVTNLYNPIGGKQCKGLTIIDTTSGDITVEPPLINGTIYSLASSGDTLFIGGSFTSAGSSKRENIAAISSGTGEVLELNPGVDNTITDMIFSNGKLWICGYFDRVAQSVRRRIAAINPQTGLAYAWNANLTADHEPLVYIYIDENEIYTTLTYTNYPIIDQPVKRFNIITGEQDSWEPAISWSLHCLAIDGDKVYGGSEANNSLSDTANGILCFSRESGALIDNNIRINGGVYTINIQNNNLYAGGNFTTTGGSCRYNVAALNTESGELVDWNPKIDGYIGQIRHEGDKVYIIGSFKMAGDLYKSGIKQIDAVTGEITSWDPKIKTNPHWLNCVLPDGDRVYIGGTFDTVNNLPRKGIVAVDNVTGALLDWNPWNNGTPFWVNSMAKSDSLVYIGGVFNSIGGANRKNTAAIRKSDGTATDWNPGPNGEIAAIALSEKRVYLGGNFNYISGQFQPSYASVDIESGNLHNMSRLSCTPPQCINVVNDTIYLGADFKSITGIPQYALRAFSDSSGEVLNWIPLLDKKSYYSSDNVREIIGSSERLILAGLFSISNWEYYSLKSVTIPPARPSSVSGQGNPCLHHSGNEYSVTSQPGTTYLWSYTGTGANFVSGQGTSTVVIDFTQQATPGNLVVTPAKNGVSGESRLFRIDFLPVRPEKPTGETEIDLRLIRHSDYFTTGIGTDGITEWTITPDSLGVVNNQGDHCEIEWQKTGIASLSVHVTYSCGEETSDTLHIAVINSTGTVELATNSISIQPNPFNNFFSVIIPTGKEVSIIEIYDLTGSLVLIKKGKFKGNLSINSDVFPQGIYLLKVTSSDQQVFKIIRK